MEEVFYDSRAINKQKDITKIFNDYSSHSLSLSFCFAHTRSAILIEKRQKKHLFMINYTIIAAPMSHDFPICMRLSCDAPLSKYYHHKKY